MIDSITMNHIIDIPLDVFRPDQWKYRPSFYDGIESYSFVHLYHGLHIRYKPSTHRLTIMGRLVMTSIHPDRVTNLDELLAGITEPQVQQDHSGSEVIYSLEHVFQNLHDLTQSLNDYLSHLVGQAIDVRVFHVTLIEVCFNVITDHVAEYIQIFNAIFEKRRLARYKNFVIEWNLQPYTSFYIKGKVQYEKKESRGFVINFYNKLNQLQYLLKKSQTSLMNKEAMVPFGIADFIRTDKVLRMEVKCHYKALYEMYHGAPRYFESFLNPDDCRDIVIDRYEYLLGHADCDFYSYKAAISKIESSDLTERQRISLKQYILYSIRNHTVSIYMDNRYRGLLRGLGIHWFLIPTRMCIDYLESPIKMLNRQVDQTWESIASYEQRMNITQAEIDLHNSIEVSDDEVIII